MFIIWGIILSPHSLVSEGSFLVPWSGLPSAMARDLFSPPSPLGDSLLDSPLCGDLMEDLRDISRSIGDDALGFDFPVYRSTGSGSESSVALGEWPSAVAVPGVFVARLTGRVTLEIDLLNLGLQTPLARDRPPDFRRLDNNSFTSCVSGLMMLSPNS